jgi:dTDP-L-rhamnose 4-epimerase
VDALVGAGIDVRVVDRLEPPSHEREPSYLNPHVDLRCIDLSDEAAMKDAARGIDAICHQAARVGFGVDFSDAADYARANDVGTSALLAAAWSVGFRGPLVLASSMVVYGEGGYMCRSHGRVRPGSRERADLEEGRFDLHCPDCGAALDPVAVDEGEPLDPRNVYAATKVHQEHLCEVFSRETKATLSILRYHNVYGPRMPRDTPYAGVASIFRSALESGRAPQVFEDGRQVRDFVHVDDVVRANLVCLLSERPTGGAFNIASGDPHTIGELANAMGAGFGDAVPTPEITGRYRLGDVRHVFASPQRAAEALGFRAEIPFEIGMKEFATSPLR